MFVDSHCHLNYLDDPEAAIRRAQDAGVHHILTVGVDPDSCEAAIDFAARYPWISASAGEHPGDASGESGWVEAYLSRDGVVAVGETGLDFFHEQDGAGRERQQRSFEQQLQLADTHELPVIIHTRQAEAETLELLEAFPRVTGVLHCFTESQAMAERGLALGYYISLSGIVTFRNGDNVRALARMIPADRLLIETDAPWLAPVPHRGKQNESSLLPHTAEVVAAEQGCEVAELGRVTAANFFRLFTRAAADTAGKNPESA